MKFTVNRNDIQNVMARIQGLTSRKSNLAITSSVLIQTAENGIKITATDLETGFEGFYMADVEKEGKLAINSKKFYEITRDFPNETILINEIQNHWIEIGNKNVEYHIVGMDSEEFPNFPVIENVPFFEMDAVILKKMIEKTVIITGAGDEKRAHIIGVYFDIIHNDDEKIIRLVSTDGNRMSTAECIMDDVVELPDERGFIIPKKGLVELGKFMDYQGRVKVGFKENHFVMQKDGETLVIRLLDGAFPKYQDIIKSKEQGNVIHFNKQSLLMMLKRMSILSSEDYRGVVFNFLADKLLIHSANPDIGESKEEMEIEFDGEPIEISFNPKYFIETLNAIEDDKISARIIDQERPCLVEGEKDRTFLSAIMPMRI
jgi:DNA polymerase-3 subunit beta